LNPLLHAIVRHPGVTLAATLALALAAGAGIVDPRSGELRLWVDPSVNRLLPQDSEDVRFYEHVRRLFGNDEIVLVALEAPDVLEPDVLRRIERVSRRLAALPGVDRVLSLATALDVRGVDGDLAVEPFLEPMPRTRAEARAVRERVEANPIYRDLLLSGDGRAAAFLVYFREIPDRELLARGIDREIAAILAEEEAPGIELHATGTPLVKVALNRTLLADLLRTLPLVFVAAAAVLAVGFRSLSGVAVPLLTIAVALVWTLGLTAWSGWSLNLVTAIVPPLVVTVGFAYAIHVMAEYDAVLRRRAAGAPIVHRTPLVRQALGEVGIPVVITGITTAAGFLSVAVNDMAAIREFGYLAVVGVAAAVLASLTFAPALLCLVGSRRRPRSGLLDAPLDAAAGRLADFDVRRRRLVLGGGLVVLALSVAGATRIEVGTEYVENFPRDSEVRRDHAAVAELFRGSEPFYVVLESSVPGAFLDPDHLALVEDLQAWLGTQPEIASTTSFVDYLKLLHREMSDGDPAAFAIPPTRSMTRQIFLFGSSDEAWSFVDRSFQTVNILVRARAPDSASVSDLVARVEARLDALPDHVKGTATGDIVLLNRVLDAIVRGQAESLVVALVVIYLILAAMFTSARVGLFALFPNVLPIAIYFGALGLSGITLNPSTSLIACIALGIAVDDTVHYLARFNTDAKRLADERKATAKALREVIRPVTFTTLGLVLGFLCLVQSDLRSQAEFGVLAAFTLAVAWAVDVTVTPALCAGVRIVTLWDVLTLDLGRAPHRTIPLFDGLSARQARIFALLSSLETVRAGERLITEGEEGDEMFLVVEGALAASVTRNGERHELSRMGRGDVVGEVALFSARRSADVDAVTDVRLLRFGESDLHRVRRRYPRIAATVFLNLNKVQAARIVENTRRIA